MTVPLMSPGNARLSEPPDDFKFDGCTCFPDTLWTPWGKVQLRGVCRIHDWHYAVLRRHAHQWTEAELTDFRSWADLCFRMRLVYQLKIKLPERLALAVARVMWIGVRRFGGSVLD